MSYGFNNNTYKVIKRVKFRDVFERQSCQLEVDEEIGSAIANAIIVTEEERSEVVGLEGNPYIDKMVELGYIEEVV